jgi:phage replication-related protein YjqB (UPF0714/DUF867 family)
MMTVPLAVRADVYDCYTRKGDPACEQPLDESGTCKLGQDFEIHTTERDSLVTVLAIHAGRIELDAGLIAAELAARLGWDLYEFQGHGGSACLVGMNNPAVLHITSALFNEPTLLSMVSNDRRTISIHGYAGSASDDPGVEVICAGGRDDGFIAALAGAVAQKSHMFREFDLVVDGGPEFSYPVCRRLDGDDENNVVNRNSKGAGVQLEMSLRLRRALVESSPSGDSLRELFFGSVQEGLISADGGDRETIVRGGRDARRPGMTPEWSRLREAFSRFVTRLRERIKR